MAGVAVAVHRRDIAFVLASYAIMLDRHFVGRLEDGGTLETTVEPGEHIICARRFLSYGPPLTFSVTSSHVNLECGYTWRRPPGLMAAFRTMRWVTFRVLPTADDGG